MPNKLTKSLIMAVSISVGMAVADALRGEKISPPSMLFCAVLAFIVSMILYSIYDKIGK